MPTPVYPHLTVKLDRESFFADLMQQVELSSSIRQRLDIREEILKRDAAMIKWLIDHGYRCGDDYFDSGDSYRFANNGLAIAFALVWGH